uniref:Uncharacterized protein n=1 Tax=Arundo donax TaxID=35708 RepID=A0A0A9EHE7_ARUDO
MSSKCSTPSSTDSFWSTIAHNGDFALRTSDRMKRHPQAY